MKHIVITQRVDIIPNIYERRDALDQRWNQFAKHIGAVLFPIPNNSLFIEEFLKIISPDGIILSGGNNPIKYNGDAPERDFVDNYLIKYSINNKVPLIGVCRGMQSIIIYFNGELKKVYSHVATKHVVTGKINRIVNSYHTLGLKTIPECFSILANSKDGVAECIKHISFSILGIMWHPERNEPFNEKDIILFKKLLNREDI